MDNPDFWDFVMEGGWDLLNSEECPHCGRIIYAEDLKNLLPKLIFMLQSFQPNNAIAL
jgi:hypothetical protein